MVPAVIILILVWGVSLSSERLAPACSPVRAVGRAEGAEVTLALVGIGRHWSGEPYH